MSLPQTILERIRAHTGAKRVREGARVQSLWSGYGEIRRVHLSGAGARSVIVKHVDPPPHAARATHATHARGWDTDRSHARKLRSYAVELSFYRDFAAACGAACRVPTLLLGESRPERGGFWFLLEDMDESGFPGRRSAVSDAELDACLGWLADFHATFLGVAPAGLWPVGTYWHLDTRPDELRVMDDAALQAAAPALDAALSRTRFTTLVHGDAKLANACFSSDGARVAMVDFQYVGGGCGMKDVAYFLSSCLSSAQCEARADAALDRYFDGLRHALRRRGSAVDAGALERDWRALYPVAWADFCRFLSGWAPDHHKRHAYSQRMTRLALAGLSSRA